PVAGAVDGVDVRRQPHAHRVGGQHHRRRGRGRGGRDDVPRVPPGGAAGDAGEHGGGGGGAPRDGRGGVDRADGAVVARRPPATSPASRRARAGAAGRRAPRG